MKHALAIVMLAGLICVGCDANKTPPNTGKPKLAAPAGDPMPPLAPRTVTPAPAPEPMPLDTLAPAEPIVSGPAPAPVLTPVVPMTPMTPVAPITPAAPVATPPAPAVTSTGGTYTIKKGDTFIRIAREVYGTPSAMKDIQAANPGVDPRKLKVGQVINLPDITRTSSR